MKTKLIIRGCLGFPIGIAISHVITIIMSAGWAKGYYAAVPPALIQTMGSEINAVALQAFLSGILGTGFAMASVIWDIDSWSLARQSGIYFIAICALMFPIAYVTHWMAHSLIGIISYVGLFVMISIGVWIAQYFIWRRKIRGLNDSVRKNSRTQ